jgi:FAD/FMN-containing dehydrogenase
MLTSLRSAFSGHLLTAPADMEPFLVDWRKTWRGVALAVAQPDSAADVAATVRWCAAHDVAIVPQGGNTGQSGGSVPSDTGRNLIVSLTRLNKVRALDVLNNTITVDAGCILQTVQDRAADAERLFPLSLGAEGSCTIGGNLATNAGGTAVLRYGNARDLCLGLEVVTPQGDVWDGLNGLRKNNNGYDLRDLYIGSEGTLGIITGAVLKLFPKPTSRSVAIVAVATPEKAMQLFDQMRSGHDTELTGYELFSHACLDLVLRHFPACRAPFDHASAWYVLIELSHGAGDGLDQKALETVLAGALESDMIQDGVIAASTAQMSAFWQLRESISEAQGRAGRAIKHDVAVPVSRISSFIADGLAAMNQAYPDAKPVIFGHLGDGNLHFNFSVGEDADQAEVNRAVHDTVRNHGGTISAEHGLGVLRRDEADLFRPSTERKLMRAIKQALDPQNIMNPGKLLP